MQGQAVVQVNGIEAVPVPAVAEPAVAPETLEGEPGAATTATATVESTAAEVATPISEPVVAQGDRSAINAAPASITSDNTPVIIAVASVIVLGGIVWLVLQFGPGIIGIRGIVRGLIRR